MNRRKVCAADSIKEDGVIKACVLRVCERGLLVCDLYTLRELLIQTLDAEKFHPGDRIQIQHSGTVEAVKDISKIAADQICHVEKW